VYGGKVDVREGSGEKVIVDIGSNVFVGEDKGEEG
jgi:prefoldin subunit 5